MRRASVSVHLYICKSVGMCICVYVCIFVNDGWEDFLYYVFVGVVSPDSGCRHPGVFSFARTLLFGTLSLKTFGKTHRPH